jgi:signal transduction histidine kinase
MATASIERLYSEETERLVATRLPVLTLVFAVIFAVAWALEVLAHPQRTVAYGVIFGLELVVCLAGVLLTRAERYQQHSIQIVVGVCAALCALIGMYYAIVRGDAAILALALAYLVTGVTVFLPLGARGQFAVAVAATIAYGGALFCGAPNASSDSIIGLGLVSIGGLSVAGAAALENYRYASFRRAEELRQANTALAKANEAKNLFLANVSHELRTPLNVMLGYSQLMLDDGFGPLSPELRAPLERMIASTQSLVYLISDLLDLSRIEAGRLEVHQERVKLAPLFEELAAYVASGLVAKPVRFVSEDPGELAVTADPDRLRQVLVNLLSNATKFTEKGEIRLRAAASESASVEIDVVDSGVGIAPEDLPLIFEPFHRAHNAKEVGGVGIGLSISARLARAMGGEITVRSTPNQGSTFSVRLQAAPQSR